MANRKISEGTSLTGANAATGDLLPIVDVSDTTDAASGTTKAMTLAEMIQAIKTLGVGLVIKEQSSDPADPAEGEAVLWQSDGSGFGDDGDIVIKVTAGGTTKTVTLIDFSAATDEEP